MIKIKNIEGFSGQEVQDYIDTLVDDGANAYECVISANCKHVYRHSYYHEEFRYAGVSIDGGTFLSDDIDDFIEYESSDIINLLKIRECAKKICNAVFETGDHDEIEKQAIEIRSLLS